MNNKRVLGVFIGVGLILLIPLLAMQFSSEVNWKLSDFIVAGILLLGTGFSCEYILRKVKTKENRLALIIGVVFILLLVWAELAVGVFGTPLAGH